MDLQFIIGIVVYGGAMLLLGGLITMWLVFGPTLWWDESEHEPTTHYDVDEDRVSDRLARYVA